MPSFFRRLWTFIYPAKLKESRQPGQIKTAISNRQKSSSRMASGEALAKLREFGYAFNAEGQLRKIDLNTNEPGDEPFQFDVCNDHDKNQEHYEKLANQIPEIVYDLLEQNGLSKTYIPEELPDEQSTFFFTYPEILKNSKKLLVIIHGSGYVRAGQWARSLIINNSLDHGTVIPYIKRAQSLGYDVLVTNTNDNYRVVDGVKKAIPGLSTPSAHASHIWKNYVMASEPESVAIVAHSFGGALTMELASNFPDFFQKKVFAIALTDSVHFAVKDKLRDVIAGISCNWVASSEPLDTEIKSLRSDVPRVSAGHTKHEWTSYSAFDSVFKFLEDRYEKLMQGKEVLTSSEKS